MNQRISLLKDKMSTNNIDGMIVENPLNIKYLTGLDAEGILLISKKEDVFITDARYIESVNNTITIGDNLTICDLADLTEDDYLNFFKECNRVYFEEDYVTYKEYHNIIRKYNIQETVEANHIIEKMREQKDSEELSNIEKACNITDSCFLHLQDFIKVGMTEKQIAFEIKKFFIENGADGEAFDTIVASGSNSSMPHAIPTDKKIENGDPVLIDFGAKYKGYCADMTRTIFVGSCSREAENLYNFVLQTQENAFTRYRDGANAKDIAGFVQHEFYNHKFNLVHALGHGVGLYIHERPVISERSNDILKEKMVVTNEPGIYINGLFGIRIEDTLLINKLNATNLTKSNKNLLILNN